jgi:hypothetical protein
MAVRYDLSSYDLQFLNSGSRDAGPLGCYLVLQSRVHVTQDQGTCLGAEIYAASFHYIRNPGSAKCRVIMIASRGMDMLASNGFTALDDHLEHHS